MPLATFLNGRNPTTLRGLQFLALSDVGTTLTRVNASDAGGGATQTWTAGTVSIPCRVDPVTDRGTSQITGGRIDERSTHVITTPTTVTVGASDRFVVTGRGTFEVTATHERTAEWARSFEVLKIS